MASRVYSFKASGEERSSIRKRAAQQAKSPPIGIKTPLQLSYGDKEFLEMNYDLLDNISDNLKNLVLTNHGERLFDYNFGANLKELAFELGTEESDSEAIARIQSAVSRYMPFVSLNTFEAITLDPVVNNVTRICIRVSYTVPAVSQKEKTIEVIIYTVG